MTDADPYGSADATTAPDGLDEVLALTAALAAEVHAAHVRGSPVPDEKTVALVKAARLLRQRGCPWPPALALALRELAADFGEVEQDPDEPEPDPADATAARERTARLLAGLRFGRSP